MDYSEFYILSPHHPNYLKSTLWTVDPIDQLLTKIETLLFTAKGEVLGAPLFGADLESKLWKTSLSKEAIIKDIKQQISLYIPEMNGVYGLEGEMYPAGVIAEMDSLVLRFYIDGGEFIFLV